MLYYAIPYYTILYYIILYYTIPYYTIFYYTILYYAMLCYTIRQLADRAQAIAAAKRARGFCGLYGGLSAVKIGPSSKRGTRRGTTFNN